MIHKDLCVHQYFIAFQMGLGYSVSHTQLVNYSTRDAELEFYKGYWIPVTSVYSGLYTSSPPTQFNIKQSNQIWSMKELARATIIDKSDIDIHFFVSEDQTVRAELNTTNPALWKFTLRPTRMHIKLINKSNKNVTILGSNSLTVIPNSYAAADIFTDIATDLGTELNIKQYKQHERKLAECHIEDGLVFECKDKDGCVHVIVTNNYGHRPRVIPELSLDGELIAYT